MKWEQYDLSFRTESNYIANWKFEPGPLASVLESTKLNSYSIILMNRNTMFSWFFALPSEMVNLIKPSVSVKGSLFSETFIQTWIFVTQLFTSTPNSDPLSLCMARHHFHSPVLGLLDSSLPLSTHPTHSYQLSGFCHLVSFMKVAYGSYFFPHQI